MLHLQQKAVTPGVYKKTTGVDQVLPKYFVFLIHLYCHSLTSQASKAHKEFMMKYLIEKILSI